MRRVPPPTRPPAPVVPAVLVLLALLAGAAVPPGSVAGSAAPAATVAPAAAAAAAAPLAPREPAVAGSFYPAGAAELERTVRNLLAAAAAGAAPGERPLALLAPHAGYAFSGPVCARAWAEARGRDYDVVVVLGTNHRLAGFRRISVRPGAHRTPLGVAATDLELARALLAAGGDVVHEPEAERQEHSVEVQIPFAQVALPGVPVVGVVVGEPDPARCERFGRLLAGTLRRLGRRALIVASSDLSHYPAAADARAADARVLAAVAGLDPQAVRRVIAEEMGRGRPGLATCACGEGPILVALAAARELGAGAGRVLAQATSADAPAGSPDRVVGYGAVVFTAVPAPAGSLEVPRGAGREPEPSRAAPAPAELDEGQKAALLRLAREAIRCRLQRLPAPALPAARAGDPALARPAGAFVTLEKKGELRGCIGHMAEDLPLWQTVRAMAVEAAFGDRRFPPLEAGELAEVALEISVLTPLRPVPGPEAVVVGRDGVVIRSRGRSAVFLPQVATEQGWTREQLLEQLCRKAGLPPGAWREPCELLTFRAIVFGEPRGR